MQPQVWFFRGLTLHDRVPSHVLDALRTQGRVERWGHQAEIFHDATDQRVYVILQGGAYVHDPKVGQRVRLRAGDAFGGLAPDDILNETDDAAHRRKLYAFDDTLVASVPRGLFEDLTSPHLPTIEAQVGARFNRRTYAVPISPILYADPEARFAQVFLHLAQEHGQTQGGTAQLSFPYKPWKIAPLLGVDKPYSKALAQDFMRRGLIESSPQSILIPSVEALRERG